MTGQWVQYETPQPITFDRMRLQVVADGRHSVPTAIELQVDGAVREITLPAIRNRPSDNATVTVPLHFPALTGRRIRVTLTGIRTQLATRLSTDDTVAAPVGLAELGIPGLQVGRAPASLPGACRSDLLSIDGRPFPVRVTGDAAQASRVRRSRGRTVRPGPSRPRPDGRAGRGFARHPDVGRCPGGFAVRPLGARVRSRRRPARGRATGESPASVPHRCPRHA